MIVPEIQSKCIESIVYKFYILRLPRTYLLKCNQKAKQKLKENYSNYLQK